MSEPIQNYDYVREPIHTLDSAVNFVRQHNQYLRDNFACFLGIAGGVVNKGISEHDTDFVLLPLNGDRLPDQNGALDYLKTATGCELKKMTHYTPDKSGQPFTPLQFYKLVPLNFDFIVVKESYV